MYIKSYIFRSAMRDLFITNFASLKSPALTIQKIKQSTLYELKEWRSKAEVVEYMSPEATEAVIMEYVKAHEVWHSFLERSITYNFQEIFLQMISIIHFIHAVAAFKEKNPDKLFVQQASTEDGLMKDTLKILGDGIRSFLDYAIELKENQPQLFYEVLSDYPGDAPKRPEDSSLDRRKRGRAGIALNGSAGIC